MKNKRNKKQLIRTSKGITLIALVITIIVLLILAGVTIATLTGDNGLLGKANNSQILNQVGNVDESIKLYKSYLQIENLTSEVSDDDLVKYEIAKEYIIEETLKPILVIKDYDKLKVKVSNGFGDGYKTIPNKTFEGNDSVSKEDLDNVCAIDEINHKLYYIKNGKVYAEGQDETNNPDNIFGKFQREEAILDEWEFNATFQTLTEYKGDLTTVRGDQQVGELIIPNFYNGKRVKKMSASFTGNKVLTKLTISNGIEYIKYNAFAGCSNMVGDLIIPDSVTSIGEQAFSRCSSLDGELKLGKNLSYIGQYTFRECSNLKGDLIIPDGLTTIPPYAFYKCSSLDGKLVLGKNLKTLGDSAFFGCNSLTGDLIMPESLRSIDKWCFNGCSGFNGKLELNNGLETIGNYTFEGCSNLKGDLIIPDTVKTIGARAFKGDTSFDGILKLSNNVQNIQYYAFLNCRNLKGDLIIPDSVTSIGEQAFSGCSSLDGELKLGENLQTIGNNTFRSCSKLKGDVTIPKNVSNIYNCAFYECNELKSIKFLNKDTVIYDSSAVLPQKMKIIGYVNSTAQIYASKFNRVFEEIVE